MQNTFRSERGETVNSPNGQGSTKACKWCKAEKPLSEFSISNGYVINICKPCKVKQVAAGREAKKAKALNAEELIQQIEDGSFQVDQKWLLTEYVKLYTSDETKDKLKCLDSIAKVSGYNEGTADEKAVMQSLMASLRDEAKPNE